jgi:hypothetical protein
VIRQHKPEAQAKGRCHPSLAPFEVALFYAVFPGENDDLTIFELDF